MNELKKYAKYHTWHTTMHIHECCSMLQAGEVAAWINDGPAERGNLLAKSRSTKVVACNFFGRSTVLKNFAVRKRSIYKSTREYAYTEFLNTLEAEKRGVLVPKIYLYFEHYTFPANRSCGLVMEMIENQVQFSDAFYRGDITLFDIIPVLTNLYELGVNHTDISPYNVFISEYDNSFTIIDWQQASFLEPCQSAYLVWASKHLFDYLRMAPGNEFRSKWLNELHHQSGMSLSRDEFHRRIDSMWGRKYSMQDRLALNFGF
jgi:hypothetical protein